MEGVTALNTVFMYLKNEFGEAFLNEIKDWSIGNLIEKILGEQISSLLDLFDMFSAIDDAFDNHSPDTSFIMIFVHAFFLVLSSYCPAISIGADMLNDLIDKIIENIDYGIILG